jgi:hypothetical protein
VVALTAAATSSAWNAGGSILTFYFPIGLFIVITALLWLQFGRPHAIPGRKPLPLGRTGGAPAGLRLSAAGGEDSTPVGPSSDQPGGSDLDQPGAADHSAEPGAPEADT